MGLLTPNLCISFFMATKSTTERRIYTRQYLQRVNNGPFEVISDSSSADFTLVSDFYGVQNPGWRRQVRRKENATTIASGTKETILLSPFFASMAWNGGAPFFQDIERIVQGDPHADLLTAPPDVSQFPGLDASVNNAGLLRFLNKCLAEQRKLQGGVVLGELRKTIQLIRNPAKALNKAVHDYVRAFRGRARQLSPRQIPRALNEAYLEFTYGAIPLFADIAGAYDACIRLRDLPQTVKVRSYYEEVRVAHHDAGTWAYYDIWCGREDLKQFTRSVLYKGEVKVQSVGPVPPLREVTGLGLRQFIPTVYELIPYSFLVDYFTNLGDIINGLSFCQADLAWYCRTNRYKGETIIKLCQARPAGLFNNPGVPLTGYSFNPCYAYWKKVTFSRDALPLGLPSLAFKMPSMGQFVNIGALASIRVL